MSAGGAFSAERHALAAQVKAKARSLGFDLVGVADPAPSRRLEFWRRWLAQGRHGTMRYLERRLDERTDPSAYLPGCRSVICLAVNHHAPLSPSPAPGGPRGRIARYALGDDYHDVIKPRLYAIADWLRQTVPGARTRCGTDSAPIMERELAARAGLGWVGKNTMLIHPRVGSWILLGEVLTTVDLPFDAAIDDHCGSCTRCIDACPTDALAPYAIDARRCISYLTIEHQGPIDHDLQRRSGDWLFGCDVCQDVCPFNGKAPTGKGMPQLGPRLAAGSLDLEAVIRWTPEAYASALRRTPVKRIKLPVLKAHAKRALELARGANAASPP